MSFRLQVLLWNHVLDCVPVKHDLLSQLLWLKVTVCWNCYWLPALLWLQKLQVNLHRVRVSRHRHECIHIIDHITGLQLMSVFVFVQMHKFNKQQGPSIWELSHHPPTLASQRALNCFINWWYSMFINENTIMDSQTCPQVVLNTTREMHITNLSKIYIFGGYLHNSVFYFEFLNWTVNEHICKPLTMEANCDACNFVQH